MLYCGVKTLSGAQKAVRNYRQLRHLFLFGSPIKHQQASDLSVSHVCKVTPCLRQ